MNRTIIYGASDDLIEVDGDVREEFMAVDGRNYLGLSNGVLVAVACDDDGYWRTTVLPPDAGRGHRRDGEVGILHTLARGDGQSDDEDGCPGYSDKLEIVSESPVLWVLHGESVAR